MTTFADANKLETGILYEIVWRPEDMSLDKGARSYVVAQSIGEACERLTSNPHDIVSVTRLGNAVEQVR